MGGKQNGSSEETLISGRPAIHRCVTVGNPNPQAPRQRQRHPYGQSRLASCCLTWSAWRAREAPAAV